MLFRQFPVDIFKVVVFDVLDVFEVADVFDVVVVFDVSDVVVVHL